MYEDHDTSPHFHALRLRAPFHVPYLVIFVHRVHRIPLCLSLKAIEGLLCVSISFLVCISHNNKMTQFRGKRGSERTQRTYYIVEPLHLIALPKQLDNSINLFGFFSSICCNNNNLAVHQRHINIVSPPQNKTTENGSLSTFGNSAVFPNTDSTIGLFDSFLLDQSLFTSTSSIVIRFQHAYRTGLANTKGQGFCRYQQPKTI